VKVASVTFHPCQLLGTPRCSTCIDSLWRLKMSTRKFYCCERLQTLNFPTSTPNTPYSKLFKSGNSKLEVFPCCKAHMFPVWTPSSLQNSGKQRRI
jgi:hypothetical protein